MNATNATNATTMNAACPFKAWSGRELPTDKEGLFVALAECDGPTFPEFATRKTAARKAVESALRAGGHVAW